VRAEDLHQVQRRRKHRLQDLVGDRRCGVSASAAWHFGDSGCGGTAPGPEIGADAVGGEQVSVVDQVDDDLRGSASDRGALFTDDAAAVVEDVAAECQVCLAGVGVDRGQCGDVSPVEPAEEIGSAR